MTGPNYKSYPGILALARNLRNNQTSSEILVWNILRRKKLSGYKFLRQHPIFYSIRNNVVDFYIADFYCAQLRLIIEVDGKIHENHKEYDKERDSKLLKKGINVFRIKNEAVKDPMKTIKTLMEIIEVRLKELTSQL
jgi:very-short-patch-repair endonuclease